MAQIHCFHPQIEYNVRWKGYPNDNNTWETAEHLNCPKLLKTFDAEWDYLTDDQMSTFIPVSKLSVFSDAETEQPIFIYADN